MGGPVTPLLGRLPLGRRPTGHQVAESPSRRAAERASARKPSSPRPHRPQGASQAHPANAKSDQRRVPAFASSRCPLTRTLGHLTCTHGTPHQHAQSFPSILRRTSAVAQRASHFGSHTPPRRAAPSFALLPQHAKPCALLLCTGHCACAPPGFDDRRWGVRSPWPRWSV